MLYGGVRCRVKCALRKSLFGGTPSGVVSVCMHVCMRVILMRVSSLGLLASDSKFVHAYKHARIGGVCACVCVWLYLFWTRDNCSRRVCSSYVCVVRPPVTAVLLFLSSTILFIKPRSC